jgi:hypothetical protein
MAAFFPAQVLLGALSRRTLLVGGVDEGSIMGPINQRRECNKFEGDGANREFGSGLDEKLPRLGPSIRYGDPSLNRSGVRANALDHCAHTV